MSTQLNLIIPKIKTSSGQIYISEMESNDKQQRVKIDCLSLLLSEGFDIDVLQEEKRKLGNQICFRQFQKMKKCENEEYYIFEYVEGKTIEKLIHESFKNSLGFSIERISSLFQQIMNALYLLHKQNILGRVFSTNNIIERNGVIVLMDFGFGPDIYQPEVNIISPPEIIQGLKMKQQHLQYDLKLDSWLVGAFLYHCGKFSEIFIDRFGNNRKEFAYCNENIDKYISWLKEQKSSNIAFYTERYPLKFCEFVEALLSFDSHQRLSFSQIYQNEFVQSLKIENREEKIKFYQQLENSNSNEYQLLINTIMQREKKMPPLIITHDLQNDNGKNQYVENQLEQYITPTPNIDQIYQKFIYQIDDEKYSTHKMSWIYINMEQFKFFLLNYTANYVVQVLEKQNYQLEYLVSYSLQKMSLCILNDLVDKLNQKQSPWRNISEIDWNNFLNNEKQQLEQALKKKHLQISGQLKQLFYNHCKKYIEDERIDIEIRNNLKFDQTSNFSYKQSLYDFLYKGYRQVITNLINFTKRIIQVNTNVKQKLLIILLLSVICHMINRILDLDSINTQFQNIKPQNQNDYISPNEIFSFITSENNYELKNSEAEHIINKNFLKK